MRKIVVTVTVGLALLLVPAGTALATADENASCVGIAFSEHGPAHEMPGEIQGAQGLADDLGVPLGQVAKQFAQIHGGTHADCEEAFGEIIGG